MASIAVVYHSGYGHTKALAESVHQGADAVEGATASLHNVEDFNAAGSDRNYGPEWDALNEADAIVFGCPTYMGSVSAGMKKFFEISSGLWGQQAWKDKLAGGFTNSGSLDGDKHNTMTDLVTFAAQHSMLWVPLAQMPSGNTPLDTNRTGAWLGLHSQSDSQAGPDTAPPEGDHKTARFYAQRIAELAKRFNS